MSPPSCLQGSTDSHVRVERAARAQDVDLQPQTCSLDLEQAQALVSRRCSHTSFHAVSRYICREIIGEVLRQAAPSRRFVQSCLGDTVLT